MSTFESLIADLTRDVQRAQPKDALQFCANWFQSRLEEQRARTRDLLSQRSNLANVPQELYTDALVAGRRSTPPFATRPSVAIHRSPMRASIADSPFGTLVVPGNALLHADPPNPTFRLGTSQEQPPTSPLSSTLSPFNRFDTITPTDIDPDDFLHPPNSAIFQRRTSVSAESIDVDAYPDAPPPVYPKTPEQIEQIKSITRKLFIFRDLAEEQEKAVLGAMQERFVKKGEILIHQGDFGDAFYVVQSGLLHVFIKGHPEGKYPRTVVHPQLGTKVAECAPGSYVGELALLYGHPRAASVLAITDSHLWSLDRMTFRTIVLKLAHRRRMMYEGFLGGVELLSSLDAQQKSKIADALNREIYEVGTKVVVEGDPGQDKFFLIEEGEAIVTQQGQEIGQLGKGDYFGELSLLHEKPRAASVIAKTKLVVAALDAAAFRRLLGPLKDIMEKKAGEYSSVYQH
ncbi:cAMP-dependent protein kinase regulatory subunit [Leucoagaricus sp. SymC.cos]|nr:cAMP-dependent protein kinase regulatory subunit [Leucoagaricus sp. SymC.cos]